VYVSGFVVQFISFPVISGFTSSAAILIAFSQVKVRLRLSKFSSALCNRYSTWYSKYQQL